MSPLSNFDSMKRLTEHTCHFGFGISVGGSGFTIVINTRVSGFNNGFLGVDFLVIVVFGLCFDAAVVRRGGGKLAFAAAAAFLSRHAGVVHNADLT